MSKTLSGNAPKYTNFNDLHKAYNFNYKDKNDRCDLTEEEERSFVNDCFDLYEYIGFAETFQSPFECGEIDNGKKFTVLRRVSEEEDRADLCCLPLWVIQFEDGRIDQAYPEEICIAERNLAKDGVKTTNIKSKIVILTEGVNGTYLIEADNIDVLRKDRYGTCDIAPPFDAKVFFASLNGVPINPYLYNDYTSLLKYLEGEC